MTISTTLVLIFGLFCYLVLPMLVFFLVKVHKTQKIVLSFLFCLFLCVLAVGVLGKIDITSEFVTISFDFSAGWANKQINFDFSHITTFDLLINLFMLLPIGIFVTMHSKDSKWWQILLKSLLFGLICGISIEFLQFLLPVHRSVQLSDTLLNSLSAMLGSLYALPFCKLSQHIAKK